MKFFGIKFPIARGTSSIRNQEAYVNRRFEVNDKNDLLGQLRIDRGQPVEFPTRLVVGLSVVLGLSALVVLMVWFFSRSEVVAVKVDMARVSQLKRTADSVLDATGYVTARRHATVSSKVTGKVVEVMIEEGMFVEEGQIVARLDDSNLRNELMLSQSEALAAQTRVAEARARLTEARLTLRRKRELVERRLISQSEMDAASAAFNALEAQVKTREAEGLTAKRRVSLQQQRLDDLILRAPFSGVVVAKNAQPGEMISPVSAGGGFTRTGICSLVDMSSLEIEVDVNESYINRVKSGQSVQAVLDAYPDWKIPAKVIAVIPTADRQKATVKVRIGFDELDKRILPDMGVKVSFLSDRDAGAEKEKLAKGIMVPAKAIRKIEGEAYVFVLNGDTLEQRKVSIGSRFNGKQQVVTGLNAGESFVAELSDQLKDGSKVESR